MTKFYNTSPDEQETIINVDYGKREVHCYTSRYAVYDRLLAKLGEPTKTFYTDKKNKWCKLDYSFFREKSFSNYIFKANNSGLTLKSFYYIVGYRKTTIHKNKTSTKGNLLYMIINYPKN